MNRVSTAGVVLFSCAAVLCGRPATAQTAIVTKKATVTFTGRMDLNFVYRNDAYFKATKGNGTPGNPGTDFFVPLGLTNADQVAGDPTGASTDRDHSEFYLDPYLVLNFAVDVGEKARGVIELRTPFVNPDAGGKNTTPTAGFFDNFEDRTLELKQVYVELDEIFSRAEPGGGLLLRAGIMDFQKDLRGDGNAFVIGTAGSEHPFDAVVPASAGAPFAGTNTGSPPAYSSGFRDTTEPAGGYARYSFPGFLSIDGWLFTLDEAYNASTATATGHDRRDLLFWGFSGEIPLGKEYRFGKIFMTVFDLMNTSDTHVVTEGGGILLYPLKGDEVNFVELFGEAYFQQGTYARNATATLEDVDQEDAFAINAGAKIKAPPVTITGSKKFVPYVEVSYVEVSGDDNATDDRNENFVSLEDNNRTLIVENGYYGYDIDTNYRGFRAALGCNVAEVKLEVLYAYFELQDNSGRTMSGGTDRSSKIGDEIDFSIWYEYSANLKAGFTYGWLLDSHALGQMEVTEISLLQLVLDF